MKTAIVSGAGGNLGSAVVEKFLEEGFRVIGTVSMRESPMSQKENLQLISIDLLNETAVNDFIENILQEHGTPDVAVLTVGGYTFNKINDTTNEILLSQYNLNFLTTYNLVRPLFNAMKKGGRIYLTGAASATDMRKSNGNAAYALSKSLIFGLCDLLNSEAGNSEFQSTVIVPAVIDTSENRASMPDADFSSWTKPGVIAAKVFDHYKNKNKELILNV